MAASNKEIDFYQYIPRGQLRTQLREHFQGLPHKKKEADSEIQATLDKIKAVPEGKDRNEQLRVQLKELIDTEGGDISNFAVPYPWASSNPADVYIFTAKFNIYLKELGILWKKPNPYTESGVEEPRDIGKAARPETVWRDVTNLLKEPQQELQESPKESPQPVIFVGPEGAAHSKQTPSPSPAAAAEGPQAKTPPAPPAPPAKKP